MSKTMTISERLDWLTTTPEGKAEMDRISAQFVAELKAKDQAKLEYYNTKFAADFELLQKYVATGADVHSQSLLYETDGFSTQMTESTFWNLYSACLDHDGATEIEDESAMFSTYGFIHKGVVFETMSGQGTILRAYSANGETTYPLKDAE